MLKCVYLTNAIWDGKSVFRRFSFRWSVGKWNSLPRLYASNEESFGKLKRNLANSVSSMKKWLKNQSLTKTIAKLKVLKTHHAEHCIFFPRSQFFMSYHPSLPYGVLWGFFRIVRFRQKIHKHVSHHFFRVIRASYIQYACKHGGREGGSTQMRLYQWKVEGDCGLCAHDSRQTLKAMVYNNTTEVEGS